MSQGIAIHGSTKCSIAKSISWRLLATVITASIAMGITNQWELAAAIGMSDTIVKFFIYFAHERNWNRIDYGREQKQPEYFI
ncbi:MAG: DUF2061 domain-containing protein [Desulfuromonadales bacterium]|nr:DUF2061 domain-containing protein [Desulfuromonadales bacterium]